jgi:G:T-mismatch repair DNA endonuclease (very short patch repair protein)
MGAGRNRELPFQVLSRGSTIIKKFNIRAEEVVLQINPCRDGDILQHYQHVVEQIIDYFKQDTQDDDKIGIVIRNSTLIKPLALRFTPCSELDSEVLWALIYRVAQSNAEFLLDGTIFATGHIVRVPRGYGRCRTRVYASVEEFIKTNGGIIEIKNEDNKCLAHAIVLGMAFINNVPNAKHLQVDKMRMEEKVEELLDLAGISLENGGSLEELIELQRVLPPEVQIVVFVENDGKKVFFKGNVESPKTHIYLFLHNNHYNLIRSICQFHACSYFCNACYKPYDNKAQHRCIYMCQGCRGFPACRKQNSEYSICFDCEREFMSIICYKNHKRNTVNRDATVCDYFKKCKTCSRTYTLYKGRPAHKCDEIYCNNCRVHRERGHKCYIKTLCNEIKNASQSMIVYFDIECTLNTPRGEDANDGTLHEPNLLIAHSQCEKCKDIENVDVMCNFCGIRKHVFSTDPIDEFFKFLTLPRNHFREIYVISHNFRGYDSMPILRYMVETMKVKPRLIMRGTQIISADYKRLRFRDSLNFIPMALRKLPATLGLDQSLEKGCYPFLFNTKENWNYVGPMPEMSMFDPDGMSEIEKKKFEEWYEEKVRAGFLFNNKDELIKYCNLDVEILRKSCNKFRNIMIDIGNVDPLTECVTLAQCAFTIFRRGYLKPDTLGIIPQKGYRWVDTQSKLAVMWLITQEEKYDRKIQNSANGREYRLSNGMIVDGYLEMFGEKIIFEFLGCVWHSCPKCFNTRNPTPFKNDKHMNSAIAAESTERKIKILKSMGYKLIIKRECEFMKELTADPDLKDRLENHPLVKVEPINPRDAMFGGRTETIRIFAETDSEHYMDFVDFCSLYPYSMKYCKVPIKHPTIHLGPTFPNIKEIDGLVKCDILCPQHLFLPVLPMRINKKLMFVLCRSCAATFNQQTCEHSDFERMLSGTWVISEVQLALEKGYKILRIYEIWEYEVQLFELHGNDGLFVNYINTMLKLKQQASGFPAWVRTDEDRIQYIQKYAENEGIEMDMENITLNPGLRSIAKLLLNSLFGRLALKPDKDITEIVHSPRRFYEMLGDPNVAVKCLTCIGEDSLVVNYEVPDELKPTCNTINVVAAAFITAGARIRLYSYLDKDPQSTLYMDTDSILYYQSTDKARLPTGSYLGDLECEIPNGCFLKRYVSGGPKNYGYEVVDENGSVVKTVVKVKGITQNSGNSNIVNFETLMAMVLHEMPPQYVETARKIMRTKDFNIISKPMKKIFQTVNNKRRLIPGSFITLPYGYID